MKISRIILLMVTVSTIIGLLVTIIQTATAQETFSCGPSAGHDCWSIDNFPEGANTRVFDATHYYPTTPVNVGSTFPITLAAWSDSKATNPLNPYLLFHFEENSTSSFVFDESGGGTHHTGEISGATPGVSGFNGLGLRINGGSSHVRIPNHPEFNTGSFSFGLWINLDLPPNARIVIDNAQTPVGGWFVRVTASGILEVSVRLGGIFETCTTPMIFGEWVHIGYTHDDDGIGAIGRTFVNGEYTECNIALDIGGSGEDMLLGFDAGSAIEAIVDEYILAGDDWSIEQMRYLYRSTSGGYPFISEINTDCTQTGDTETLAGQYQLGRQFTLINQEDGCSWTGRLQYFDPGFSVNPAVDIPFGGYVQGSSVGTDSLRWVTLAGFALAMSVGVVYGRLSGPASSLIVLLGVLGALWWALDFDQILGLTYGAIALFLLIRVIYQSWSAKNNEN